MSHVKHGPLKIHGFSTVFEHKRNQKRWAVFPHIETENWYNFQITTSPQIHVGDIGNPAKMCCTKSMGSLVYFGRLGGFWGRRPHRAQHAAAAAAAARAGGSNGDVAPAAPRHPAAAGGVRRAGNLDRETRLSGGREIWIERPDWAPVPVRWVGPLRTPAAGKFEFEPSRVTTSISGSSSARGLGP